MTITGTVLSAPSPLSLLAAVALAGAVLPVHAFDLLYNHGIRHLTGTRALPLRGAPSRFACGVGALWLVITASLFQSGAIAAGFAVGGLLGATAALAATTDICMPSLLFRKLSGWPPARAGYAKEVAS